MADGIYRHQKKNINVMTQPFGTLWALAANQYGEITNIDLLGKIF